MIFKTEEGRRAVLDRYADYLAQWPVPAEKHTVATRQGDTFVQVSGPPGAPPLVLLHGAGSNAAMWLGDIAAWAEHFRVYAVDVIGEPGLSAESRPSLDSPACAAWLDDVTDHFGLGTSAFVGASLGAWLAVDYAIRRPGKVAALALLCPGGIGGQKVGVIVKALFYKAFGEWGVYRSIKAVAGVDRKTMPEVADYLARTFTEFLPRRERLPVFSDEALGGLAMPVLAIVGERDAMFDSRDTADRLTRLVSGARAIVLPGVGHSIVGQTRPILDFLRDAAG